MSTPDGSRDPQAGDDVHEPDHPLALALRYGLRYSGLRETVLDPRMMLYIPLEICEREMVLPLSIVGDVLEVATAYPDPDLAVVDERFTELQVELVCAPIERITELQDELRARF